MADKLVIVESPSKATTIKKYLGKGYKVMASMGHLVDLPKSQLGVDIEHDFEPKYITIRGKGDLVKSLKKEAKAADRVFLATDPDREGEAISWHLANLLEINAKEKCRITFNEITKTAVKAAIKEPRTIDENLVDAQQARRVLDRIVGYKISPLLWKKVKKGLSAGRVQSVATRLVCDREAEIEQFIPEEYWTIDAHLSQNKKKFVAHLYGKGSKKLALHDKASTDAVVSALDGATYTVTDVKQGQRKKTPAPPFTTSTLQQEAGRKLGFTTMRTMRAAQQLYEGVTVPGRGSVGLITYMRTDSLRLSADAVAGAREMIAQQFGAEYMPSSARVYKTRKGAQDAHEAIRPTMPDLLPAMVKDVLPAEQYKLYKLIWERFIACQMGDAVYDTVGVTIDANGYTFKANGSTVKFRGFTALYTEGKDEEEEKEASLPRLEKGDTPVFQKLEHEQHFTQPPSRYTEASLVKALEELGVGRPSTYSPTITTIINRGYVIRDKKLLVPTELGRIVTDLMKEHFDRIVDVQFTASMEEQLDQVEEGSTDWHGIISGFYGPFSEDLKQAEEAIGNIELADEVSDVACEKCGRMMVFKHGRFGKFLACPGFPECRNAKPIVKEVGIPCPKCGGMIIEKKSKRGKVFYGCNNYPACDFTSWDKPTGEKCETCGSMMLQRAGRIKKTYCPECDAKQRGGERK
ncbi:MAG: type I DNA topoisomerase [Ruminococcaceae bacterium]|nr:type I DNA topoisomerase [Oscillospiraceae bacterium]